MIGYIYQIENLQTHKSYIGQTKNIKQRKNKHFSTLRHNKHDNPKLQAAFNKYGEQEFHFRYWKFDIKNQEELDNLEIEYIEKYDSINSGYNFLEGGTKPPLNQQIKDDDIVKFLCIQKIFGNGYGKTCEDVFGWSKGTASVAQRGIGYANAREIFEKLTNESIKQIAEDAIVTYKIKEKCLERQLSQGGCSKAYQLTQDDYNLAFAAQEQDYSYTQVANFLGIKPATVKDWFSGRSRKKNKEIYNNLSANEKNLIFGRLKTAELSGKPK